MEAAGRVLGWDVGGANVKAAVVEAGAARPGRPHGEPRASRSGATRTPCPTSSAALAAELPAARRSR